MNILVAGIPRSGSTRLYNIIRLILLQKFSFESLHCGWHDKFDLQKAGVHNIIKLHYFDQKWCDWADVIFTTKRDLRDILASSIDFGMLDIRFLSEEKINIFLNDIVEKYNYWKQNSDLEVIFENFEENKRQVITRIFEICKLRVDVDEVLRRIDYIAENRNNKALVGEYISKKHISNKADSTYRDRLDSETLQVVQDAFADWLKMNGYLN